MAVSLIPILFKTLIDLSLTHTHTERHERQRERTPIQPKIIVSKDLSPKFIEIVSMYQLPAAMIPKTQNPLSVSDNNNLNFPLGPILQHLKNSPPAKELIVFQFQYY